jgi:ketosteroid isomerase-like protein
MSRERIDKTHLAWLDAMKANDGGALGRIVTDDVVLMPPNEQPVVGRASIVEWFDDVVRQARTSDVQVPTREVIVAGDYGIERGSYVWTINPPNGSPLELQGNFLAIYHRQADGEWKVTRHIWNSTLPAVAGV